MYNLIAGFLVWMIFGIILLKILISLAFRVPRLDYYLKYLPFIILCGEILKAFVVPNPEAMVMGVLIETIHLVLKNY